MHAPNSRFSSRAIFLLLLTFFVASCEKDSPTTQPLAPTYLIKANLVKTYNREELTKAFNDQSGGSNALAFLVQYGVEQYQVTYQTKTPSGESVVASGALIVPLNVPVAVSLASLQHGTLFNESDAPSYFAPATEVWIGNLLASSGLMVAMPDYLGYGSSKQIPHPYEHAAGLAEPSVDFLRAIKEFIASKKLNWTSKLLLAGYSEGGYATLAMQKAMEEKYAAEFNLVASSCGAGAYNKSKTLLDFAQNGSTPEHLRSYIWVIQTYNRLEGLNRPLASIFQEPFATEIAQKGFPTSAASIDKLLQPALRAAVLNKTDAALLKAFANNDVHDWKPKTPTRLYHGTIDNYVPYYNSESAYAAMKLRGATHVELFPLAGKDHSTALPDFLFGTLDMFSKYR